MLRNHFNTNSARFSGSGSLAGATNRHGCSAQYAENSTIDWEERRKGGAVRDARSPLNEASDCRTLSVTSPQLNVFSTIGGVVAIGFKMPRDKYEP